MESIMRAGTVVGSMLIACVGSLMLAQVPDKPSAGSPDSAPSALAEYYGFLPVEIYKLDPGIANLLAKDLNGDGKIDLAVMNNTKARIDLLLERSDSDVPAAAPEPPQPNVIPSDRRLEYRNIPVSKQMIALAAGDFDGDGRCDLAYYGTPGELVVLLQDGMGQWSRRRSFDIPDGSKSPWCLDAGDINGDRLDDLVLIGDNDLYVLYQRKGMGANAGLSEPIKLPFSQPNMQMVRIVDIDGDGRNDVTYWAEGDEDTLRVRFQLPSGQLGPEIRYPVPATRAFTFANVDGKPGDELLTIEKQSGRLTVHGFAKSPEADSPLGAPQFYPLGRSPAGRARGLAIGDFDGDGHQDLVVSDPQGAQLLWFHQESGGIGAPQLFPSLAGSGELRVLKRPGGRPDELVILSTSEKAIGLSRLEKGRLVFPQSLPVVGEPLAIDVADIDGDGREDIGYVARRRGSGTTRDQLVIRWIRQDEAGWQAGRWGDAEEVALSGTTDPGGLRLVDANRDGRMDWLVFHPSGPTQVLLADGAGKPVLSQAASVGLGSNLGSGAVFVGDFDGPAILVAQSNFTRSMLISADGRWQARDQFNAPSPQAKIAAVVPCDLDGDGTPELVLADTASRSLLIQKRSGAVYQPWKRLRLGAIDLKMLQAADLNGDGKPDLVIFGSDALAISYAGSEQLRLVERANYETRLRDAMLHDLVAADLNDDGLADIALVDTARHFIDIVQVGRDGQLRPALAFQAFESKSPGGREEAAIEPREILAADVTGDGRPDLILVVHDRVLVYPQDAGQKDARDNPPRQ